VNITQIASSKESRIPTTVEEVTMTQINSSKRDSSPLTTDFSKEASLTTNVHKLHGMHQVFKSKDANQRTTQPNRLDTIVSTIHRTHSPTNNLSSKTSGNFVSINLSRSAYLNAQETPASRSNLTPQPSSVSKFGTSFHISLSCNQTDGEGIEPARTLSNYQSYLTNRIDTIKDYLEIAQKDPGFRNFLEEKKRFEEAELRKKNESQQNDKSSLLRNFQQAFLYI